MIQHYTPGSKVLVPHNAQCYVTVEDSGKVLTVDTIMIGVVHDSNLIILRKLTLVVELCMSAFVFVSSCGLPLLASTVTGNMLCLMCVNCGQT